MRSVKCRNPETKRTKKSDIKESLVMCKEEEESFPKRMASRGKGETQKR